jgi:hypothetical protein
MKIEDTKKKETYICGGTKIEIKIADRILYRLEMA